MKIIKNIFLILCALAVPVVVFLFMPWLVVGVLTFLAIMAIGSLGRSYM